MRADRYKYSYTMKLLQLQLQALTYRVLLKPFTLNLPRKTILGIIVKDHYFFSIRILFPYNSPHFSKLTLTSPPSHSLTVFMPWARKSSVLPGPLAYQRETSQLRYLSWILIPTSWMWGPSHFLSLPPTY